MRKYTVRYVNINEEILVTKMIEAASKRAAWVLARRETEAHNPETVFIDVTVVCGGCTGCEGCLEHPSQRGM